MHVLMTADCVGGVWTYVRELATALVRRGVKITLVSFGEIPTTDQTKWTESFSGIEFHPTGFPLEWMHGVQVDMEASQKYLLDIVAETRPDLLHLNQYFYGAIPCSVPRVVVAHSDVLSWSEAVHGKAPAPSDWLNWYRSVVRRGVTSADYVIAPSHWMLAALERHYGSPANRTVIHNGRNPKLFNPHMLKEEHALSVGRLWDGGKQLKLLCQEDLPMDCYIAGSDRHPDASLQAENSLRTMDIPRLQFLGSLSEAQLSRVYGRASVYVATSRYEPFGLAPVEAALSRCALLLNDLPSFRELWQEDAIYFERNNPESLLRNLSQLKHDAELRKEYAERAYQRAQPQFTSNKMADAYLHLYESVVQAREPLAA